MTISELEDSVIDKSENTFDEKTPEKSKPESKNVDCQTSETFKQDFRNSENERKVQINQQILHSTPNKAYRFVKPFEIISKNVS